MHHRLEQRNRGNVTPVDANAACGETFTTLTKPTRPFFSCLSWKKRSPCMSSNQSFEQEDSQVEPEASTWTHYWLMPCWVGTWTHFGHRCVRSHGGRGPAYLIWAWRPCRGGSKVAGDAAQSCDPSHAPNPSDLAHWPEM
jgi:hypothetical protein